ncbi:hypothetical protein HAX54_043922 [Datura stramonium]|uniref:Uncharacterized protein n=1 Tax=Datura stramonium TaxID=4076 RepID=A0ABS8W1R7_DATST|nr:hypothetical protein [Datura stramonium]
MMMEMSCGLLPVHQLEPHSSAVDVTIKSPASGQQLCSAFSADCQPVQLTSEESCHLAQHVYSRRRLQSLSQGQATPEDQQSSPVASLPVASSNSDPASASSILSNDSKFSSSASSLSELNYIHPRGRVRFVIEPCCFYGAWPAFALTHHLVIWFVAAQVYPGVPFTRYAILGDDIVIGDERVAERYRELHFRH